MMKNYKLLFIFGGLLISQLSHAQCRNFVKNNCAEKIKGYVPSENFNGAKLQAGDDAELQMTFNSNLDYRLLICSHPVLGDVAFEVQDSEGKPIFNNKDEDFVEYFDFRMADTQELIIKLSVPENSNMGITPQGCVGIIVARKMEDGGVEQLATD